MTRAARLRAPLLGLVALAATTSSVHCAGTRRNFEGEPEDDAGTPPAPPALYEAGAEQPTGDCSEENKQIYVLSSGQERALWRFDPQGLTFTRIGDVVCPASGDTFSMAVDRKGNAWVEYSDGNLFLVSTKDAHCTPTAFRPSRDGFATFGMGFAKDDSGDGETLYVEGDGLGMIDTKTLQIDLVGATGLGLAELTGTGNGLLYAFHVSSGRVAKLDKTTGAVQATYRTAAVDTNASWAFAHWGGDFWLFTGHQTSKVTRYSPATDTSAVVVEDAKILIVGAGSSTCAPVTAPR
jgi:hypothetical protein